MSNVTEDDRLDPVLDLESALDNVRELAAAPGARYVRRLSDKVLIAFHHACDQSDFEVAMRLLQLLEMMLTRRPLTADRARRRKVEGLVAAHERLWHLRHIDLRAP
jgi:hypothetical protein